MKVTKTLLIQKSIYPLDWNPKDPQGYNEWMQMIAEENMRTSGKVLQEPARSSGFITPEPKFIGDIMKESLFSTRLKMDRTLDAAKEILQGGRS